MIIIKYYETCPFVTDKCSWKYEKIYTPIDTRDGVKLTKVQAMKYIKKNKMSCVLTNKYGEIWEQVE